MGVFKKLSGNDVRVTPIQTKYSKTTTATVSAGDSFDINTKLNRGDIGANTGLSNPALVYASARQLFYGAFISQNYISSGSIFNNALVGTVSNFTSGVFSRFDPSFQGSFTYRRHFPVGDNKDINVYSIPVADFGESIIPGTVSVPGGKIDDANGNLTSADGTNVFGNILYDQGIIITTGTDGNGVTPLSGTSVSYSGSYTIYSTQYKCTASPNEFNYTLNPTLLSASNVDYDPAIIDSPDFMPYVTTIGLYNENQELMMVAKLGQPVQLNPFTDTNFIIRLDR